MRSYMLLFWAPRALHDQARSAEEARESGERWHAWRRAMDDAGHEVTGGAQLESSGRQVKGKEKVVAEGPVSPDPLMGGFFIVSAASLEQATQLAKGCPVLQSGGTVEVRALVEGG
jgi:hypothetical protein